ncbi:unnamed protein product [Chrysoparadoxa australica]
MGTLCFSSLFSALGPFCVTLAGLSCHKYDPLQLLTPRLAPLLGHCAQSFKRYPPHSLLQHLQHAAAATLHLLWSPLKQPFTLPKPSLHRSPDEIHKAKQSGHVYAVKLYPAGATTNSDSGVTDIKHVYPALEAMAEHGMPLLVHGEVTGAGVDVFDKEAVFIEEKLKPLVAAFPSLKIVMEHITTKEAVTFVSAASEHVAATITPQHLLYNRNAIFKGGLCPHMYCLPILKREEHRQALVEAATSGNPKFFLGTDSAPHEVGAKQSGCGCAGIFTGHAALELYAEVFDERGVMDKFGPFCSEHGANFYGIPKNEGTVSIATGQGRSPGSCVVMRAAREGWKGAPNYVTLRSGQSGRPCLVAVVKYGVS